MSKEIATEWLAGAASSAGLRDHETHMGMISKRVSLRGVPGFDNINFDAWSEQCKHEFETGVIKSVVYKGLKLIDATDSHIMFKTHETVSGTDGTVNAQGVEMLLEKEDDGVWRLVQERVMPDAETRSDNLIP